MTDTLSRFLFEQLDIRGVLVQLDVAWRAMLDGRNYSAPIRDVLGELAAVTTVIGGNLKSAQRLSFQLQGHGPVSLLVMDCQPVPDGPLRLRGMARGEANATRAAGLAGASGPASAQGAVPPKVTLASAPPIGDLLGDGKLVLTLQPGSSQAYQSIVPLEGDTLAAIFEHFLAQSEQLPARLWLAADADSACALFLQALPDAGNRDADGWSRITQLADTVRADELRLPVETLIGRLFGEEEVRLFAPRAVCWHCPRDEEKVRDVLLSLGRQEVESMLADADHIEIADEICGHQYRFGRELLDELFPPQGRVLH